MKVKICALIVSMLLTACSTTRDCSFPDEKGQPYWVCHPQILVAVGSAKKSPSQMLQREECKAKARLQLMQQINIQYNRKLDNITLIGSKVEAWGTSQVGTLYCLMTMTPTAVQKTLTPKQ